MTGLAPGAHHAPLILLLDVSLEPELLHALSQLLPVILETLQPRRGPARREVLLQRDLHRRDHMRRAGKPELPVGVEAHQLVNEVQGEGLRVALGLVHLVSVADDEGGAWGAREAVVEGRYQVVNVQLLNVDVIGPEGQTRVNADL